MNSGNTTTMARTWKMTPEKKTTTDIAVCLDVMKVVSHQVLKGRHPGDVREQEKFDAKRKKAMET